MVDTKILASSYKFCSFELSSVIYQNPPGYVKPVYNALQELDRYFVCDICHWNSFHPLDECVNRNK
jgi:hypothetical protein